MGPPGSAWDALHHGDALRVRAARDRLTVAAVAADAGFSKGPATKAAWLAGVYDVEARSRLGRSVLADLTPMHLEVVATAPTDLRDTLLRQAAHENLTARDLRELAKTWAPPVGELSTSQKLVESSRAMEVYAGFDDRALRTLISGPNGSIVRRAAAAGTALATRISEFTV